MIPIIERARALAIAAGYDPDAKIHRPGEKPWPAWCSFREKAEQEAARKLEAENEERYMRRPENDRNRPLVIVGDHEANTIDQMKECMAYGNVFGGVLCADGHLGYAQPVGGVIAYRHQVSVSGVGFDIGCGNMAARLDVKFWEIEKSADSIVKAVAKNISFGVGRVNDTPVDHALFDQPDVWKAAYVSDYVQKARAQLGTVGSGNHYVDLFTDEEGFVWIGVHFGSRGLGHTIATRFLKMAGGKDGINAPPTILKNDKELGVRYLTGMGLAGQYAYAGREWVVNRVRELIGGNITKTVHNHHNFAWVEEHNGQTLIVVRKGATPAFPGQEGFIGGSMAEPAVIIEGVESEESKRLLYSTVHGAGRFVGRKEAHRRFTRDQMDRWLKDNGVRLIGGDLDESPMAYKRLSNVLSYHGETIRIKHRLKPWGVVMAGSGELDPWKD